MFNIIAVVAALALDPLFNTPTLAGAHTGALVIDAQSGSVLYSRNAGDAFVPASTMKLIVGSAALDILGEAFNFTTTLSTDGARVELIGGGDVLLDQHDIDDAAAAVRAIGPLSANGLMADASRYNAPRYPDGWQVDDLPYDYAAPPSALSFSENAFHIRITPGTVSPDFAITQITPSVQLSTVDNQALTGPENSPDTTDLHMSWGADEVMITGSIAAGSKEPSELDAAMLDPALVTQELFAKAFNMPAIDSALTLGRNARTILATSFEAAAVSARSDVEAGADNLLAETLLEEIGVASPGGDDTRARGITGELGSLKGIGIDPKTVTISDGSGLSSYDRVTPRIFVTILAHDWFSSHRQAVLDALPVAGGSGTLQHVFTEAPLAGNVFAKTGTSNHTRTLAGYVKTPAGVRIFALMVNDWMDSGPGSADRLHAFQAAFLRAVASGKTPAALQ